VATSADWAQPRRVSQGNMAATCAGNSNASMSSDVYLNEVNQSNVRECTSVPGGSCEHNNYVVPSDLTLPYFDNDNIVTCIPIARQRLGKYIAARNALNSRTSVARQQS
jgi:hypothetical protein